MEGIGEREKKEKEKRGNITQEDEGARASLWDYTLQDRTPCNFAIDFDRLAISFSAIISSAEPWTSRPKLTAQQNARQRNASS